MNPVINLVGIQGMRIRSKWIKSEPMLEERKDLMVKTVALKPRIELALKDIEEEVTKLAYIFTELKGMDVRVRESASSYVYNDDDRTRRDSMITPEELFQSRRRGMTIIMSIISLEMVAKRLQTAKDFNEVVKSVAPAIAVLKSIRSALIRYASNIQEGVGDICEILELILIDSCQLSAGVVDFKEANQKAILLLNDAHVMAEQKMNKEFPNLTTFFNKPAD